MSQNRPKKPTEAYPITDSIFVDNTSGRPPNGWAFCIPKNALKASFIFHLVWLNKKTREKPPPFYLPTLAAGTGGVLVGGGGLGVSRGH